MAVTSLWSLVRKAAIAVTAAVAMMVLAGQGTAAADVTNHVARCHSTVVAGVETDDCVGNATAANDGSWNQVWVEPRLFFGLGVG